MQAPRSALEELVRRALDAAAVPVGWISLIDDRRERIEAGVGIAFVELEATRSFALNAGTLEAPLYVEDAASGTWRDHPLVRGEPRARFVGVVPLATPAGRVVGALTVVDPQPRAIRKSERTALANIATLAVARVEAMGLTQAQRMDDEARRRGEAERRLEEERAFSEAVLENLSGAFLLVAPDGTLLRWNSLLAQAVGYPDERIAGMHPLDFVSAHDRAHVADAMRAVLEEGRDVSIEAEIVDSHGSVRPYQINGRPVVLAGRRLMIGMARDITLRKRAEEQMVRAKERLDLALASSSLALWDWDLRASRVYFNESWAALIGAPPRESTFSGDEVLGWTHSADREVFEAALANAAKGVSEHFDCEYRVANSAGEWVWVHSRGKVTQRDASGRAQRMTGTSTDITKRKQAEERAEYLATRDALTGLPNRVLLHDRLEQAVVNAARHHIGFAFMFIDLDRFKTINDSLGHHAGDQLLKGVAARLTACVRASDTVARLGGDEFAVILENLRDDDEGAQQVAEKMIAAMASPMMIDAQPLTTSCSIGISLFPTDGRDSSTLMKNADVAMYFAKEKGRNNYQFFSSEMNARAQERLSVESYLRLALRRNELVLHYQPRKTLQGELVGVEALVRWQHPRRGLLLPGKFIEVAEDSGLIVPIGEWVIRTACAQLQVWQRRVKPGLKVSVNLAVGQLRDGERLLGAVTQAVSHSSIDASCLELELTESHLVQDIEGKAAILQKLGDFGVRVAIDDFGTGYSSLSYLKRLPVDTIKIDSSFVRDIEADPNDEAIIRAILAMAHSLKLSVVAEGVETAAQFEALRALGCDEFQGFHESPALPPAEFERRYAATTARP
ncbi:MAG TPA: EAL domain-containing protein [Usitatibacter sp.]|nr:EAL domain-containing protein [Usitatibacter sp.]